MENLPGWKLKFCIPAAKQLYNANSKNLECYKNNIAMKKLNTSMLNFEPVWGPSDGPGFTAFTI